MMMDDDLGIDIDMMMIGQMRIRIDRCNKKGEKNKGESRASSILGTYHPRYVDMYVTLGPLSYNAILRVLRASRHTHMTSHQKYRYGTPNAYFY